MQGNNREKRPGPPQRRRSAPPNAQRNSRGRAENPQNQPERGAKPRVQNRWFTAVVMVITTIGFCIFLSFFILDSAQDLFGLNQEDITIEIIVPKDASNAEVTKLLADNGIISKPFTFRLYAGMKTKEVGFQPGTYVLNKNLSYDQIIVALKNGLIKKEVVKIPFIEGKTADEYAKQLEAEGVCEAESFLNYLADPEVKFALYDRLPSSDLRFRKLEGYLFPDTYEFYKGEKVESVAKKFFDNFINKFDQDLENQMATLGLTLDETITLASIIQKEASDLAEMRKVSAVFHNRLFTNPQTFPNLQSDVTIFYVDNFIKPNMTVKRQDMYDAYNTYVCKGLPEGPICNPGLDAIKAALNPVNTSDYFFVTDVNGKYYYSQTAEEHYIQVANAKKQVDDEGKTGDIHGIGLQ